MIEWYFVFVKGEMETTSHNFFGCEKAIHVGYNCFKWLGMVSADQMVNFQGMAFKANVEVECWEVICVAID